MCSIVGSFDRTALITLCKMNEYRGQSTHSIAYYDTYFDEFKSITQNKGPINYDEIKDLDDPTIYYIVHMQAPTFEPQNKTNIHPASSGSTRLYHNGILKELTIKKLQEKYQTEETWDTALLLEDLNGDSDLSDIDGSFSCLWYNGASLHLLRNEIAPMFIDVDTYDISSTKFDGSVPLDPNTIYKFRPAQKCLNTVKFFKTVENPYYFGDDSGTSE